MIKIAVISDIHANLPALKAVLKDIELFEADQVYCLGDLTDAAPWHNEVVDLIRSLKIPVIMGNHDERIGFDIPVLPLSKHSPEEQEARLSAINFTKTTISPLNKEFLAGLPESIRLEFGAIQILMVHGSPSSNDEYLYENHDESSIRKSMEDRNADVLIMGHTHLSYIRKIPGNAYLKPLLVINAGSVGRTKEKDRKACYLQLRIDPEIARDGLAGIMPQIRKVDYDIMETVKGIRNSPIPDFYANFLLGT
jgi:putative phosphoesterase